MHNWVPTLNNGIFDDDVSNYNKSEELDFSTGLYCKNRVGIKKAFYYSQGLISQAFFKFTIQCTSLLFRYINMYLRIKLYIITII